MTTAHHTADAQYEANLESLRHFHDTTHTLRKLGAMATCPTCSALATTFEVSIPQTTEPKMPASPVSDRLAHDYLTDSANDIADGRSPLALSSWLVYTLRGRAKHYQSGYLKRIRTILNATPGVVAIPSRGGAVAYAWQPKSA